MAKYISSSDSESESESWVVIYFSCDNTFDTTKKKFLNSINQRQKTAYAYYSSEKKWFKCEIIYEGSKEKCEEKCKKAIEKQKLVLTATEDETDSDKTKKKKFLKSSNYLYENEKIKYSSLINSERSSLKSKSIFDKDDASLEENSTPSKKKKIESKSKIINRESLLDDDDTPDFEVNESNSKYERLDSSNSSVSLSLLDEINNEDVSSKIDGKKTITSIKITPTDNRFYEFAKTQEDILSQLRELKDIISSIAFPTNQDSKSLEQVIFKGRDLVKVGASCLSKYVKYLMDILYTKEELRKGYIIEGSSTSKRVPLDLDRFELLKRAVFIKYNVKEADKEECINDITVYAKRKCTDTEKLLKIKNNSSTGTDKKNDS